ncbi:hypothetical protein CALVIDRAFT_537155 [Calocera viscosa TUFC12733]|uniref:Uncharacterized protein n=1 Tax=Calocera viscosa (strain TUFC12733) TaxID=1330018 RepID=A0A167M6A9_CALVF|nr:hypothetical protein CALVIDRAFT_537155 [Calocera viscosa TUFC12733]
MFLLARHPLLSHRCPSLPLLTRLASKNAKPKKGVLIRLLQDIPTVGRAGAVLRVPRQIMRAWYFPEQRAEYVIRPMGGFLPGDLLSQAEEEVVVVVQETPLPTPLAEAALRAPSLSYLLPVLQALPALTFPRRPIAPSSPQIFGSVTASHVLARLSEEFGVSLDASQCVVRLQGQFVEFNRVKGIGEATARIVLSGVGEVELRLHVVPESDEVAGKVQEAPAEEKPEKAEAKPAQPEA